MLADELDFVVGVDSHRDWHTLAVVDVRTGVVVFEAHLPADRSGYREALRLAERHASARRAFAVEGTGSYGAGLTRFLTDRGERVFEVGWTRREARTGGKDRRARRCTGRSECARSEAACDPAQQRRTRSSER